MVASDNSIKTLTKDKSVLEDGQKYQESYITEMDVSGSEIAFDHVSKV